MIIFITLAEPATAQNDTVPLVAIAPPNNPITKEKVELGRMLFFDPRLSISGKVSCSSCHDVVGAAGKPASGADGRATSLGTFGLKGSRNAPTVWNAGLREALFWDGRAGSLEEQARGPILNSAEMGMLSAEAVAKTINAITAYRPFFQKAFPEIKNKPISLEQIAAAIATYERTLVTPNSRFDRFRRGELRALNQSEKRGWKRFNELACSACHATSTFSTKDYFIRFPQRPAREISYILDLTSDLGRFQFTHNMADANKWRVPSLRNVELTAPYMHNGSVQSLEQVVRLMARTQIGIELIDQDVADLVAFLKTLTGEIPAQRPPKLPGR